MPLITDTESGASASPVRNEGDQPWRDSNENPLNWQRKKKLRTLCLISFQAFTSPFASSVMAPGLPEIASQFNITSGSVSALTLTIFLLAWALGPLAFGPLSEVYGRRRIINISSLIFTAFSIACVFARSTGELIAFRFLAGIGASTPISIAGSAIADMYSENDRAPANAIYGLGLLIGPPTGPIIGGYLAQEVGVRYGFVLTAALAGVALLSCFLLLPETNHSTIRRRGPRSDGISWQWVWQRRIGQLEAARPAKKPDLRIQETPPWIDSRVAFRPLHLLFRSRVCLILSLYGALVYGTLNMFFTTFPDVFGRIYGFGPGPTGLSYIGSGLGELVATGLSGWLGNAVYRRLTVKNGGDSKPEFRVPGMLVGSAAVPVGLLWFGWTAHFHLHWMLPIVGSSIFGFGLMSIMLPLQLYLIDAFEYSASALAAAALCRSLLAFAIPLFAPQMIVAMGLGGTYSFLAGVSMAIGIPLPIWIYYRGEEMRTKSKS